MISSLRKSLKENDIIGLVIPDIEYEEKLIDVVCGMGCGYNKILYLSVNKPYEKLVNKFNVSKVDVNRFLVIDCITRTAKNVSSTENCIYLSSPKALDEIQRTVLDVLKNNQIDMVLIDSPSTLLMYYKAMDVLKFMHLLTTKIMVAGCKGIIPFPKESCGPLRRSIEMFIDDTVYLPGGGNGCLKSSLILSPAVKLDELLSTLREITFNLRVNIDRG